MVRPVPDAAAMAFRLCVWRMPASGRKHIRFLQMDPRHHQEHMPDATERNLPEFNRMQTVKRRFFAMRNGALAAQMRRGGLEYRINFGLNVPQIKEIADEIAGWEMTPEERRALAAELWRNDSTRESRLLAPMIMTPEMITPELAGEMIGEVTTREVADMLCHSLLRKAEWASDLAGNLLSGGNASDMSRYTALRLLLNMLMLDKTDAGDVKALAEAEMSRGCAVTRGLCAQILDEIEFRTGACG